MSLLVKAVVTAAAGSLIALLLKRSAPELGLALTLGVSLFGALLAAELGAEVRTLWETLVADTGLSPAVTRPVLKCVGIGILPRLGADLCRDGGQGAAASSVELCGTVCALVTAMPLVQELLSLVEELL